MKKVIMNQISNFLPDIFKKTIPKKKELDINVKKVYFPEIKNPHDFVQVPGTRFIISKYEMSGIESCCFRSGVEQMNVRGISMATPYLFLMHLYNLVNCQNGQIPVIDAIGNIFSSLEVEDMLRGILSSPISNKGAYQGGTWLGPEYYSSEVENTFALSSLINQLSQKAISDEQSIFIKDGIINYGPFAVQDGRILGGTGEGDGFMFYSVGDELYLSFKCNPLIINNTPRIYGVLEQESFAMDSLTTEKRPIILSLAT